MSPRKILLLAAAAVAVAALAGPASRPPAFVLPVWVCYLMLISGPSFTRVGSLLCIVPTVMLWLTLLTPWVYWARPLGARRFRGLIPATLCLAIWLLPEVQGRVSVHQLGWGSFAHACACTLAGAAWIERTISPVQSKGAPGFPMDRRSRPRRADRAEG